jgi:hypothetical protein
MPITEPENLANGVASALERIADFIGSCVEIAMCREAKSRREP